MIGKIMQNHSFRATSRYVLEKEKAELIGGNLFGETLDDLVDELAMTKSLNPDIARPVYHFTQSYTAADKQTGKLTHERLEALATLHFAGMVLSATEPALLEKTNTFAFHRRVRQFLQEEIFEHSFFIAVHQDREHTHTHLVASRINLSDGKCIPTWYERVRSKKICRLLEQQFDLEPVPNTRAVLDEPTRERVVQTAAVLEQLEKTGTSLEATDYTLIRQGATLTLRRRHDDSIALKAYQDKQKHWRARGGDLTEEECVWWEAMNQAPAAASISVEFEALIESESEPAVIEPTAIEPTLDPIPSPDPLALQTSQQAWGREMAKLAWKVLQLTSKTVYEGEHYRWVVNGDVLTIEAKDGRGLLVKYQHQRREVTVSDQITKADRDYFQSKQKAVEDLEVTPVKENKGNNGR